MIVCTLILRLELDEVSSLKGRRSVINSLREKLKTLNVSILDISDAYPKEATLALAFLSPDAKHSAQYREQIESLIESRFPQYPIDIDYEEF